MHYNWLNTTYSDHHLIVVLLYTTYLFFSECTDKKAEKWKIQTPDFRVGSQRRTSFGMFYILVESLLLFGRLGRGRSRY